MIKSLWNKFLAAFDGFIKEAFDAESKLLIGQFKDVAIAIIAKLMVADLSSDEKRAQAFKELKEAALAAGKDLSSSMINLLIELAVARWKKMNA
jgi:hypothetical protein